MPEYWSATVVDQVHCLTVLDRRVAECDEAAAAIHIQAAVQAVLAYVRSYGDRYEAAGIILLAPLGIRIDPPARFPTIGRAGGSRRRERARARRRGLSTSPAWARHHTRSPARWPTPAWRPRAGATGPVRRPICSGRSRARTSTGMIRHHFLVSDVATACWRDLMTRSLWSCH